MNRPAILLSSLTRSAAILALLANLQSTNGALLAQETPPPDDLHIVIIDGDSFTNNVKKHTAREPIVEVRDRRNSPVPGANVVFTLPNSGASGTFANGGKLVTAVTDQSGRATTVFRPNSVPGSVRVNVSASAPGHATTTATIVGTNVAIGMAAGTVALIVGIVAAAAAGTGVALANRGGGKSATVSAGTPTVQ